MKKWLCNALVATGFWTAYNTIFLVIASLFSLVNLYELSYDNGEALGRICTIFGFLLSALGLIPLYFLGKKHLKSVGNFWGGFLSVLPIHILILALLWLLNSVLDGAFALIGWLMFMDKNFTFTALLSGATIPMSFIPYFVMALGMYRQGKTKSKTV